MSAKRSKKLSHQMSRYLGSETAESDFAELFSFLQKLSKVKIPDRVRTVLENFSSFLDVVDQSYEQYENNLAVAERSLSLSSEELVIANRAVQAMVNSLGQGFLMFDKTGVCSPVYSKACETLLETIPSGKPIATVLRLDDEQKEKMESLLRLVFGGAHAMSFDEIMRFAPHAYAHTGGAHIRIDYKAEMSGRGEIDRVVVVATDVTEQIRAREMAEERKALFDSLERIFRDRQAFGSYMRRLSDMLDVLDAAESPSLSWEELLREVHTLKGGAGMFRLNVLMDHLHDLETSIRAFMDEMPFASVTPTFVSELLAHQKAIRDDAGALSRYLENLLGVDPAKFGGEKRFDWSVLHAFAERLAALGLDDLRRTFILDVCSESLPTCLRRFDLSIADLSARLNKKVHPLIFVGDDIRLVEDVYQNLFESFVHIFRNIVDHGIEPPENREQNGKDPFGSVTVDGRLIKDGKGASWIHLEIRDDGAGIDADLLRSRLREEKALGEDEDLSDRAVLDLLLTRSLSSRRCVNLYSGRGVGVSAVFAEVRKLGGRMFLDTTPGKGTTVTIEVPYILELRRA